MTEQQKQALRSILLEVYCRGLLPDLVNTTEFLDAYLEEVLKVLATND